MSLFNVPLVARNGIATWLRHQGAAPACANKDDCFSGQTGHPENDGARLTIYRDNMIILCNRLKRQPCSTNRRKPVEQVGMRWPLAHNPKVRRGADEAPAKMVEPGAVHEHRATAIGAAGSPRAKASRRPLVGKVWIFFGKMRLIGREAPKH